MDLDPKRVKIKEGVDGLSQAENSNLVRVTLK